MTTGEMPADAAPSACRGAVFYGANSALQMDSFPKPEPGPGEALVRIQLATICGSDLHTYSGKRIEPTPTILGHEAIGVVSELGADPPLDIAGDPLQQGDIVTWSVAVACHSCERCERGMPQKCLSLKKYGHLKAEGPYALSGGFAEYIVLRRGTSIVKLPPDVSELAVCPANCATATVAACYRTAGPVSGKTVLIFGAGMLGLTAVAFAKEQLAKSIVIIEADQARGEIARSFGADHILNSSSGSEFNNASLARIGFSEFDAVFELSGSATAVGAALEAASIGGKVILAGSVMPGPGVEFAPEQIVRKLISLHGVHNYTPADLLCAIEFLRSNHLKYPFADQVDQTFPLDEITQAFEFALRYRPVRVAIRP